MRLLSSDQYQSRPYLTPLSHNKPTSVTDGQTDGRQPHLKLDRYVGTVG